MHYKRARITTVLFAAAMALILAVAGCAAPNNAIKLLNEADKKFGRLTSAELGLFITSALGGTADLSAKEERDNEPNNAMSWPSSRTIRDECIEWLCTNRKSMELVSHRGIHIKGARIDGNLDLIFANISFPLWFEKCVFSKPINLQFAKVPFLCLDGSQTGPIYADALKVEGGLHLREGFTSKGGVSLKNASMLMLDCSGGHFINPNKCALNMNGLYVKGPILMEGLHANGEIDMVGATVGSQINFDKARIINPNGNALSASNLKVDGSVFMSEKFQANGSVVLSDATIGGNLHFDKAHLSDPNGISLNAIGCSVKGNVFLSNGFKAEGEIKLIGATVTGVLGFDGAHISNPKGVALNAMNLKSGGGFIMCNDFRADGEVILVSAIIRGALNGIDGCFINHDGVAIRANRLRVEGNVFLGRGLKVDGEIDFVAAIIDGPLVLRNINSPEKLTLDLRFAQISTIGIDPNSWPQKGKLLLDGLVYSDLFDIGTITLEQLIKWLRLQPNYRPQPYQQMANILRKAGRDADAKKILIAKNQDRAERGLNLSWSEKFWYHVLGPMINYGHEPLKAIWVGPSGKRFLGSILFWLVSGCVLFGIGKLSGVITPSQGWAYESAGERMQGHLAKDYPRFNFIVYSIDSFVPLIDLHQAKYWLPNPNCSPEFSRFKWFGLCFVSFLRSYLWLHISMGWILTTLLVVGLTGLVRT